MDNWIIGNWGILRKAFAVQGIIEGMQINELGLGGWFFSAYTNF